MESSDASSGMTAQEIRNEFVTYSSSGDEVHRVLRTVMIADNCHARNRYG